jgi:hypothetical protein
MGSMKKRFLVIMFVIVATITACVNNAGERWLSEGINKVVPTSTPPSIGNVQINQGRILPPYGMKVEADRASLKLRMSSSKDSVTERFDDIKNAVTQISALASEHGAISLEDTSVSQVSGGSSRATAVPYFEGFDSSSVNLKLTIDLGEQNHSLFDSVIVFNDFLNDLNLSETITVQALSVETAISNPEMYRPELVSKVYQELAAVQEAYGQSVQFEITCLHGILQTLQLTDTEYYIYLEPNIIVSEF